MFVIEGKVALITGGASGIGLAYAKELLRNGLKAVTLADINEELGRKALSEIKEEFGDKRAICVKTDVSDKGQFQDAFKATVANFENVDILINNAGIINESIWEKLILININGTINGVLLALDYLKYRTDSEGVIVNISSVAGLEASNGIPVYTASKHAILGMSRAWGSKPHYERTRVKVLTLCPGPTKTPMVDNVLGDVHKTLGPEYTRIHNDKVMNLFYQTPEHVAKSMVTVIKEGESGSVWVIEDEQPPYEITIPSRQDLRKS